MTTLTTLPSSPLAGRLPVGLGGWLVGGERTSSLFRLSDVSTAAKLVLHAAPAGELAERLNVALGRVESFEDGLVVAGLLPGQWLVLGAGDSGDLAARLVSIASAESISVVDVTDGRFLVRLTGPQAPLTLARLCAVDLGDRGFPNGSAATTLVAGVRTTVLRDDLFAEDLANLYEPIKGEIASYLLCGDRSQARWFVDTVLEAGTSLGLEFEGAAAYRSARSEL